MFQSPLILWPKGAITWPSRSRNSHGPDSPALIHSSVSVRIGSVEFVRAQLTSCRNGLYGRGRLIR